MTDEPLSEDELNDFLDACEHPNPPPVPNQIVVGWACDGRDLWPQQYLCQRPTRFQRLVVGGGVAEDAMLSKLLVGLEHQLLQPVPLTPWQTDLTWEELSGLSGAVLPIDGDRVQLPIGMRWGLVATPRLILPTSNVGMVVSFATKGKFGWIALLGEDID